MRNEIGHRLEHHSIALRLKLETSDRFEQEEVRAGVCGDDADTTAAVIGQMTGAFYGAEAIPAEWLEVLHQCDRVQGTARSLWRSHRGGWVTSHAEANE